MRLNTSIQARRSGTVIATGVSGARYEFKPGADGELECDVADAADVAALLATHNFYPADEGDFEAALALTRAQDQDDPVDANEDDAQALTALPVEANTPPQPERKRAPKKGKALA